MLSERKFAIDSAIVKTMKTRKQLPYRELVKEVMSLLRFPLETWQMEQMVDFLVRDFYIEQADPEDPPKKPDTVYKYVA